jgi:hypothetical protein
VEDSPPCVVADSFEIDLSEGICKKGHIPGTIAAQHNAAALSASEMAAIWGAYRQGINGISTTGGGYPNQEAYQLAGGLGKLGCNGLLALPIMKYMKTIFP